MSLWDTEHFRVTLPTNSFPSPSGASVGRVGFLLRLAHAVATKRSPWVSFGDPQSSLSSALVTFYKERGLFQHQPARPYCSDFTEATSQAHGWGGLLCRTGLPPPSLANTWALLWQPQKTCRVYICVCIYMCTCNHMYAYFSLHAAMGGKA